MHCSRTLSGTIIILGNNYVPKLRETSKSIFANFLLFVTLYYHTVDLFKMGDYDDYGGQSMRMEEEVAEPEIDIDTENFNDALENAEVCNLLQIL